MYSYLTVYLQPVPIITTTLKLYKIVSMYQGLCLFSLLRIRSASLDIVVSLWVVATNTGIFLRSFKPCDESFPKCTWYLKRKLGLKKSPYITLFFTAIRLLIRIRLFVRSLIHLRVRLRFWFVQLFLR